MLNRLLTLFQMVRANIHVKRSAEGVPHFVLTWKKQIRAVLVMGLIAGAAVGVLLSCTSGYKSPAPAPGQGSLFVFIGDTPLCDVLSSRFTVTGLTATPFGGGFPFPIITSSSSYRFNLGGLRDFTTILTLTTLREGTYDQAKLSIALLQMGVYEPTLSPPVTVVTGKLSTTTPTFNIDPPLVITKGKVSALEIDYDVLRSVQLTKAANGALSATVTPVFHASALTADPVTGFGERDDLMGFVRSVNTSSTNPSFVGGFVMQFLSGSIPSGAAVNVSYTEQTKSYMNGTEMEGKTPLNHLLTGSFVELDGYVDDRANLVANTVEVEDQENPFENRIALIGLVTSLRKDPNNNLTGFNLWVRQEEPDASFSVPVDNIVDVNVSSSTSYQFSSRSTNFANLTFDSTALAVGQEVIVHGPFTPGASSQPVTVAADKVYLKLQSLQGGFATLLQAGSDDKTGAFQLTPCCTLLQGAPVYVLTNNQTTFVSVPGLGELNTQSSLLVKGLPFFQPAGGTINGVPVPPGTLVVLAKQVHQLQ